MAPSDPEIASDLAAAYLERGDATTPGDLILALETARTAIDLDKRLPEARFNQALALERLFLTAGARQAWNDFLRLDPSSGWADEASVHLRQLAQADRGKLWQSEKPTFARAVDVRNETLARSMAGSFRQQVRLYGEVELLERWAEATSKDDSAEAQDILKHTRLIGDIYASLSGDWMLHDAVAAIDHAAGKRALRDALSSGHHLYARGLQLYEAYNNTEARAAFHEASLEFTRGGSPFRLWAEFFVAACDYQQSNYRRVIEVLTQLERNPRWYRYGNLAGRTMWLRGVILAITADPASALKSYLGALSYFKQTGEVESLTAVEGLLAEVFFLLGDDKEATSRLYRALEGTAGLSDLRRRHQIFHAAAEISLQAGDPRAALCFESETLYTALATGNAVQIALSFGDRAAIRSRLGQRHEAGRDLKAAREYAEHAHDETLAADILLSGAEVLGSESRDAGITELNAALPVVQKTRYNLRLAIFYLSRGRLQARAGRSKLAKADFLAGIGQLERVSKSLDFERRGGYLDRSFELFDEVIRLEVVTGLPPYSAAFQYLERARCDALAAWPTQYSRHIRALGLTDVARALPDREVLIEYAVLPDRLIAWVIERGRIRCRVLPISEDRLTRLVSAFRTATIAGGGDISTKSAALYKAVIAPLALPLSNSLLSFVPDKILHQVPFAALYNPETGRYLIEDYGIELAPSVSMHLALNGRRDGVHHSPQARTALVIGDPAFDPSLAPYHARLPWAKHEASEVATLYKHSDLLVGKEATKERFIVGLGVHSVVHLAAHAEINQQSPLLSRLLLAPSHGDSGVLFAQDLYGRRFLRTELVVLSGCGTASGPLSSTEGILSLAKPFLAGGVPAVIGSLWRIDDRIASALAIEFHRKFSATGDATRALASAQRVLLHSADAHLRDPSGWGAFEIIGMALSRQKGEG
ncbi:MAG TPA: CHAT domain-containing protein [Thermoanaerobaculia bacterium]|nr:CHAT domain-containing protein [Thermoanaerobaculia bacterium]